MKVIPIGGVTQKTQQVTDSYQAESIIFNNLSDSATISTEMNREKETGRKLIPNVNIAFLAELQNKLEFLLGQPLKVLSYSGTAVAPLLDTAIVDLAINGEIPLGKNDYYNVVLKSLGSVATSKATLIGGSKIADALFNLNETKFKKDDDTKEVDLSGIGFLAFKADALPSNIEFISKQGERLDYTSDIIKSYQKHVFGVVGFDFEKKPIVGFNKTIVLDVRGAKSVLLKDEAKVSDITFYSI